jgi:hypothetical protein
MKVGFLLTTTFLTISLVQTKNFEWKTLEEYFIKLNKFDSLADLPSSISQDNFVRLAAANYGILRKRKGPFLSMFPKVPKHPNLTENDVGKPLILTPFIKSGKINEAKDLSRVRNIPDIETYSGFLTVNKKYDSNLFFWYVPSKVSSSFLPASSKSSKGLLFSLLFFLFLFLFLLLG